MNNSFVEERAAALASRVAVEEETSARRVRLAYRLLYGRVPTVPESQMATQFLAQYKPEAGTARSAWTGLMRVLMTSNEFFYVD